MKIDGRFVFKLYSEKGMPLDVIAEELESRGHTIDYFLFLKAAYKEGWTFDRTMQSIGRMSKSKLVTYIAAVLWPKIDEPEPNW